MARTISPALITISNGHGAWAMALSNTLSRGDRVLVLETGVFARVWAEMAEFDGVAVETVSTGGRRDRSRCGRGAAARRSERAIKAVLMVQSTRPRRLATTSPQCGRALDAADHPALLMVDCIASMGCEPYEMDAWGVDVTLAASQKGLMTPPGLGLVSAGPRALAAHKTADMRTRYSD